ncbi:MAG: hypothetical protein R3C12_16570 [Planctomycetaceae bacterium]
MTSSTTSLNRRQFLGSSARNAAQAAAGVVGLSQVTQLQARPRPLVESVQVGIVGLKSGAGARAGLPAGGGMPSCRRLRN